MPRGYTIPLVTDDEQAIVNSIKRHLGGVAKRLGCWNHLRQDMKSWVREHGGDPDDIRVYWNHTRRLLECDSEEEFLKTYTEMSKKWSSPFLR